MKINKYILFFILSVVLISLNGCRPKGILSSREMRVVLADLHKTDAMLQTVGWRIRDYEVKDIYYAQTLARHGVSQAQFDSSLVWYTAHPQFFNKIYPKVLKDLEAEEAAYTALHEAELAAMRSQETGERSQETEISKADLDSILWVTQHGWPSSWQPLVHDLKDQFFPQFGVTSGGVIDTLETGVNISEISYN